MKQRQCEKHEFIKVLYTDSTGKELKDTVCRFCSKVLPKGLSASSKYKNGVEYPQMEDYPNEETYQEALTNYREFTSN